MLPFMDHPSLWIDRLGRFFAIGHNYDWDREKENDADNWAFEHGLSYAVWSLDSWYGHGTLAIRIWFEPDFLFRMGQFLTPMMTPRKGMNSTLVLPDARA